MRHRKEDYLLDLRHMELLMEKGLEVEDAFMDNEYDICKDNFNIINFPSYCLQEILEKLPVIIYAEDTDENEIPCKLHIDFFNKKIGYEYDVPIDSSNKIYQNKWYRYICWEDSTILNASSELLQSLIREIKVMERKKKNYGKDGSDFKKNTIIMRR